DKVSIFVQNNPGPEFAIWTGKLNPSAPPALDPSGPTPQIEKVTFTDIGQNMHIQIDGAGFGNAPATLPVDNQLDQFSITDTSAAWCAGKPGCEVYLQYTSWTKTRIVIDGFGPQYGNPYKVASGDDVSIYIENNPGPEFTIWKGTLQ